MADLLSLNSKEANPEITRKLVGVANFLWGGDKLMWKDGDGDDKAAKMILKGRALLATITARESEMDPSAMAEYESVKREIAHRLLMLEERRRSFPLLNPSPQTLRDVLGTIRWKSINFSSSSSSLSSSSPLSSSSSSSASDASHPTSTTRMELEVALLARCDVFCDEVGIPRDQEIDELEASATHLVGMLGDAIVGGARFWFHPAMNAVVVDRLFACAKYRGHRLYRRILTKIVQDNGVSATIQGAKRLVVLVRTDYPSYTDRFERCITSYDRFVPLSPPLHEVPPTVRLYYATLDDFILHAG